MNYSVTAINRHSRTSSLHWLCHQCRKFYKLCLSHSLVMDAIISRRHRYTNSHSVLIWTAVDTT